MSALLLGFAAILLFKLIVGLVRVERGPLTVDRMLAAQLMGTSGVAILLLLAEVFERPAFRDVALAYAMLAVIAAVAFVKRAWRFGQKKEEETCQ